MHSLTRSRLPQARRRAERRQRLPSLKRRGVPGGRALHRTGRTSRHSSWASTPRLRQHREHPAHLQPAASRQSKTDLDPQLPPSPASSRHRWPIPQPHQRDCRCGRSAVSVFTRKRASPPLQALPATVLKPCAWTDTARHTIRASGAVLHGDSPRLLHLRRHRHRGASAGDPHHHPQPTSPASSAASAPSLATARQHRQLRVGARRWLPRLRAGVSLSRRPGRRRRDRRSSARVAFRPGNHRSPPGDVVGEREQQGPSWCPNLVARRFSARESGEL